MKLTVFAGPMFSFKTKSLERLAERKRLAGYKVLTIKPNIAVRDGPRDIKDAHIVANEDEFKKIFKTEKPDFLVVEEGQFFGEWFLEVVESLMTERAATGFEIAVAGLDMDAKKKPFGIMPALMARAHEVVKLTGICEKCGRDGNLSYLKKKEKVKTSECGNVIKAGDADEYGVRCEICYYLPK